jgi:hypothetical protein
MTTALNGAIILQKLGWSHFTGVAISGLRFVAWQAKAEKTKLRAQEKTASKLASAQAVAKERRARAEAKLNQRAARVGDKADLLKRTGHLPSSAVFSLKLPLMCSWKAPAGAGVDGRPMRGDRAHPNGVSLADEDGDRIECRRSILMQNRDKKFSYCPSRIDASEDVRHVHSCGFYSALGLGCVQIICLQKLINTDLCSYQIT